MGGRGLYYSGIAVQMSQLQEVSAYFSHFCDGPVSSLNVICHFDMWTTSVGHVVPEIPPYHRLFRFLLWFGLISGITKNSGKSAEFCRSAENFTAWAANNTPGVRMFVCLPVCLSVCLWLDKNDSIMIGQSMDVDDPKVDLEGQVKHSWPWARLIRFKGLWGQSRSKVL